MSNLGSFVRGTCMEMCPATERALRERECLIHPLEATTDDFHRNTIQEKNRLQAGGRPHSKLHFKFDPNLMVKCYHRSAAGVELNDPSKLRPAPVLMQTVEYLLTRVVKSKRVPWCEVHWFVSDRLRSVRQDANIQQIDACSYVKILEQCIRFYAKSMYRRCPDHPTSPSPCIDSYLNRKQLEETLHQCIALYDEDTLYSDSATLPPSRIDIECVHLVVNIDSYAVLQRALSFKNCTPVQTTLQLCIHYSMNNYSRVFRLLPTIPCVAAAAFAAIHLPRFRKRCMQIINAGFSCKNNYLPLSYLRKCLLLSKEEQVRYLCDYYGLKMDSENCRVLCCKGDFQTSKSPEEGKLYTLDFVDTELFLSEELTDLNLTNTSILSDDI